MSAYTRENIAAAMQCLKENGLTPFDLIEWTHLLDLREATQSLLGLDINVRASNCEAISEAVDRKAAFLDREYDTVVYPSIVAKGNRPLVEPGAGFHARIASVR